MRSARLLLSALSPLLLILAIVSTSSAQTLSFASFNETDGSLPYYGPLAQGTNGYLYGTAYTGGVYGRGTVFKVNPADLADRSPIAIYNFCPNFQAQGYCSDGDLSDVGMVLGTDGDFYGAANGGAHDGGTIFKITSSGHLTTLYNFCSLANCADGLSANLLVQGTDGNFYGTTTLGGNTCFNSDGCGTVFTMTPEGVLKTLHRFCSQTGCPDGTYPEGGLIQASDGNFYGTTNGGGTGMQAQGTIFRITPSGVLTTIYAFCTDYSQGTCLDGTNPMGSLVQGSDGDLYGTTQGGGAPQNGTVFKVTTGGALSTLYSFAGPPDDGELPSSGLIQATDGNFYGTTLFGGDGPDCYSDNGACGTVFEVTPSGAETVLHNFVGSDGAFPFALVQATNGALYGTAWQGGANGPGYGTVFSVSNGLGQLVQTVPIADTVGKEIKILGTGLTGSTAVSFDGVAASTFKVVSSTEMTATVPSGALTGTLSVTTPSGTLNSRGPFYVTPQLDSFTPKKGPVGTQVQMNRGQFSRRRALSRLAVSRRPSPSTPIHRLRRACPPALSQA
jgi:uncharacterized repeat protein (TIGR03803 family)